MTDKPGKAHIPSVDRPEVSETFADSISNVMVRNGVFQLDFTVHRAFEAGKGQPPKMKKFTAARIALTTEGAIQLCNMLNNMLSAMERPTSMKPDIKFN